MKKDALINEYLSAVSLFIICSKKKKKAFLSELKTDVEAFIAENQQATKEDIESVFGTPESIASYFISNVDSKELKRKMSLKRLIVVAVIVALVIYFAFVVISLIDVHTESHGYFEEGLVSAAISLLKGGIL